MESACQVSVLSQLLPSHWPKQFTWPRPKSVWEDTGKPEQIEAIIVLIAQEEGRLKIKIWVTVYWVIHKAIIGCFQCFSFINFIFNEYD